MGRSTNAVGLLSVLDAVGQGKFISSCIDEVVVGARSAVQLLAREQDGQRAIDHNAGIDANTVFDSITAA